MPLAQNILSVVEDRRRVNCDSPCRCCHRIGSGDLHGMKAQRLGIVPHVGLIWLAVKNFYWRCILIRPSTIWIFK